MHCSTLKQVLIILLLTLLARHGLACSCDTVPFNQAVNWADEIFIGRAIAMNEVSNYETSGYIFTGTWSITFEVTKKWKGSSSRFVTVVQPNTSCDFFFNFPDYEYLVYAKKEDSLNALTTHLCARNADMSIYDKWTDKAWDDRPLLDKEFPSPIQLASVPTSWALYVFGVLLLLGGMLWLIRIRKTTTRQHALAASRPGPGDNPR